MRSRSLLVLSLVFLEMEERVEPLAHDHSLPELNLDLLLVKWPEKHEANCTVESSSVQPDWKKSLAHDGGEVALLDVEHVGQGEDEGSEISGLTEALSVVKPVDNGSVLLPVVVIHVFLLLESILIIKLFAAEQTLSVRYRHTGFWGFGVLGFWGAFFHL